MARFEMTLSTGETILVDHSSTDMDGILKELSGSGFLLFSEVKGVTAVPSQVIVASSQIALVRPLDGQSRQGSSFRPKR